MFSSGRRPSTRGYNDGVEASKKAVSSAMRQPFDVMGEVAEVPPYSGHNIILNRCSRKCSGYLRLSRLILWMPFHERKHKRALPTSSRIRSTRVSWPRVNGANSFFSHASLIVLGGRQSMLDNAMTDFSQTRPRHATLRHPTLSWIESSGALPRTTTQLRGGRIFFDLRLSWRKVMLEPLARN